MQSERLNLGIISPLKRTLVELSTMSLAFYAIVDYFPFKLSFGWAS